MSLFAELKRRNVFRVGGAYAVVGWLLVEVASVVLPTFKAPEWVMQAVTLLVILGFPLALIFAWAFELTPEGIKREKDVQPAESMTGQTGRKLDFAIIGLLGIAVVYFAVDKFALKAEPEQVGVVAEQIPAAEGIEREKSIAVLLFDNLSGDAATQPFTNGIHDDILTQISKIGALKVIARTSMERLDPTLSIPEIGTKLGVAAILEGGVQRAGDRVRINVQLIDCADETHLWAETYDRELTATNIFSIQREVAETVAHALQAALSPEERDQLAIVPTRNLAAYEAYLLGKQRRAKLNSIALAEAAVYFQQAIKLDSNFALAHAALADSYLTQIGFGGLPHDEMIAKAEPLIEEALKLDDRSGEAYVSLAHLQMKKDDYEGAETSYQRALELNPNNADAWSGYGALRIASGRFEEALTLDIKAVELDPLSAENITTVGMDLDALGRLDEGLS